MSGRVLAAAILLSLAAPAPAAAQWPGTIAGRVVDAATGQPIAGALVELPELTTPGSSTRTAQDGAFSIHGIQPGAHELRTTAPGYLEHSEDVRVRNGMVARVGIALRPQVYRAAGLHVGVAPLERQLVVGRSEIAASGARTAAHVLETVPGVVVHGRGPAAPATLSIRGSDAGHVLVLLDGAVLNDPVTGAADLSSVSAATIESITVHPGARSARYGPGAVAGVVVIASREPEPTARFESGVGSLGEQRAGAGLGVTRGAWTADATAHLARVRGEFDFELPAEAGGGGATRANADLVEIGGLVAAAGTLAGGALRLRVAGDRVRRGIPGKAYAPSPEARQELDRFRAAASWRGGGASRPLEAALQVVDERVGHRDPAPPAGRPYDHTARIGELRSEVIAGGGDVGPVQQWHAGVQLSAQRIRSDALEETAPSARLRAGAFIAGESSLTVGSAVLDVGLTGRMDRDGEGTLHPTFSATVAVGSERLRLHGSARSSFTPPALADQFFRQGVAVEPNPELRGERVPLELEVGATARTAWPVRTDAGIALFQGDVRDMIVWAPDFRFVWRPRNTHVRRWGGEAWADADLLPGLRARASYALSVVSYDSPGSTGAQLAYRPRHTGRVALEWSRGDWRTSLASDYTGERYPTAARVNRLPPYWRTELSAGRGWRFGDWRTELSVHVDRLLDEKKSMIFGYPEPGRTFRLKLDLERALRK